MSIRKVSSVILTIAVLFALMGCEVQKADVKLSDKTQPSATTQQETKKDEPKKDEPKQEEKVYKIGDTIKVNDKYEFTITKVSLTDKRNKFSEKAVQKVAIIDYNYKNINSDEDLLIMDMLNFKLYDEEGTVLEPYPAGVDKLPQKVAKGKQCSAQASYGFDKGSKLELQFYDNMFANKADAKFILEIK